MKKIIILLFSVLLVLPLLVSASASVRVGVLAKLNIDDTGFNGFVRNEGLWKNLPWSHGGDDLI